MSAKSLWTCIVWCACIVAPSVSCSSSVVEKAGWEGIRGHSLRVYVALEIPEDTSPAVITEQMAERLLDAGKKRAELLLAGYLRESIMDAERAEQIRGEVPGIIATAVMVDHECDEVTCSAVIDFTVGDILRNEPVQQ